MKIDKWDMLIFGIGVFGIWVYLNYDRPFLWIPFAMCILSMALDFFDILQRDRPSGEFMGFYGDGKK